MKNLILLAFIFCLSSCTKNENELKQQKPPIADFTYTAPTEINVAISFKNSSTNAVTYEWDFGDGTLSTEENPIHTYKSPGTYAVILVTYGSPETNVINDIKVKDVKIDD